MSVTVMLWMLIAAVTADVASAQGANRDLRVDCGAAQNAVQRLVCADAGLRELDEHLARYVAGAQATVGAGASCVRDDHAAWLTNVRGACRDASCLRSAYLNRLAELDPLQPGATAVKNIELPADVAALVWVIGPASDEVAAPNNPKAVPFEGTGTLVDEVGSGDGFVLRTADGSRLLLAMLMFLEPGTTERLAALATAARPVYRVRGHIASDGAQRFFEPSRCAFVYR